MVCRRERDVAIRVVRIGMGPGDEFATIATMLMPQWNEDSATTHHSSLPPLSHPSTHFCVASKISMTDGARRGRGMMSWNRTLCGEAESVTWAGRH